MTEQKPVGSDDSKTPDSHGIKNDSGDELRSNIEQTLIVYQTLREMRNNSPTAWPVLLDDIVAAIQAYANRRVEASKSELIAYAKSNAVHGDLKGRDIFVHGNFVPLTALEYKDELEAYIAVLTEDEGEDRE